MLKQVYMAIFTLREYRRATWFYMEIIAVAITLYIYADKFWLLEKQDIYLALGFLAMILALITTVKISNRETNPRIYVHMTKALSRIQYLSSKALSIFFLDALILLMLFLLCFKVTRLGSQLTLTEGLVRMVPIYLVLLISVMAILATSRLVLNKAYSFLLGVIIVILGFYHPAEQFNRFLPPIRQLIKGSYEKSLMDMNFELLLAGLYIIALGTLACLIFNKRELSYEQK